MSQTHGSERNAGVRMAPPGVMAVPKRVLVFTLADQCFAVDISSVERVARAVNVAPLPKAPDIILGVVNVQGRVIPVVSMRRRFRLPERELALTDALVIAHTTRRPVAFVADAVTGVVECDADDVLDADEILPSIEHVASVAKLKDGLALIHDLDKFLSLEEDQSLETAMTGA